MVTGAAAGHKPSNQPKHLMVGLYFLMAELYYLMIELYFLMLELYFFLIMESWLLQNVGFHRSFLSFHKIISIQNLKSGCLQMSFLWLLACVYIKVHHALTSMRLCSDYENIFERIPPQLMHFLKSHSQDFLTVTSMEHDWVNYVQLQHPTKMTYLNVISSNSDRFFSQEEKYNLIANSDYESAVFESNNQLW